MKELKVSAIKKGTVIDHIHSEEVFKVMDILKLEKHPEMTSIAINLGSKKMGKKAIIKIENKFLTKKEVDKIAIFCPTASLNIIKNYKVAEKTKVRLPETFENVIKCPNPNCITNHEEVDTQFRVIKKTPVLMKCHYCERIIDKDHFELVS
ncbi:MAG: aspartate carbamoyltransferase regulatory subunit [Candidatus Woesearchaeota archaeon]|nr:MAG: aspartate carbamoyltransferase regulatory subunit [Candidatus Woesearchaeota archaeon]